MFKNYLKTTWRNLVKHRSYSLINASGLALGIASGIIIFLIVQYELGYDKFHTKADRIYRVTLNAIDFNPAVSLAVAAPMRNDFPELEQVSQIWFRGDGLITIGKDRFQEKGGAFADQYFSSVFDYSWLQGNYKTALQEPNSVVLTSTLAHKYFGGKNAMGQMINLENNYNLKVTGVIEDLPGNTNLPFKFLVSFKTIVNENKGLMRAFYAIPGPAFTFIVTPKNYDIAKMQSRIHGFVEKNWGKDIADGARLPLQPLTDIHFDTRYLNNPISYTTAKETYYVLSAVAFLIIIIACINFINLATAQGLGRAKEVGVRKVLGSSRSQLVAQSLGETAFLVVVALLLGVLLTSISLPQLSEWLDIKLNVAQIGKPSVITLILSTAVMVVLLAGLYPAFVQSAFKPIESLRSKATISLKGLALRKSLVVVQFAVSQIMIVGTVVVAYQMDFFRNQNLGFNKEAVISLSIPDMQKNDVLKQQLSGTPGVSQLTFSSGAPVVSNFFTSFISPEAGIKKDDVTELKFIDEHYTDMFRLKMLAGNKVTQTRKTEKDTVYDVAVNEAMIRKLNIQHPQDAIGKQIIINGNWQCTIAGVVQDFQSESKHKAIRPCVLLYRDDNFFMASVKLQPANMNKTLAAIDKAWSALFPQQVFSYEFLDEHIAAWYRQEQKEYTAFKLFAGVAIIIGCLGLYGLIAFAAAQRIKEVGIRKVLGASLSDIVLLFSKEFAILICLAFLIAAPIAYYVMNSWLQSFAYQIKIGVNIFIIAILSSFAIAACTIAYQAIRAAIANPVKSLRTDG